jgi:hypothetical protein
MEYYLGLLLVLVGVLVLVWVFVRPRRGDEPHCRKCNINLVGLKEPARCPECGRDLAGPRAMVRGQRPSRKRGLCWFVGLALMGGAFVGLDAMNRTGFIPLNTHKPAALLQAEAYLLEDLRASRATDELVDRITRGAIGVEARDRLVRTALARHAQTWRSFPDGQWGVITQAISEGRLSVEQLVRVWENCIEDMRLIEVGENEREYLPGEQIDVRMGVNFRAGAVDSTQNGLGFISMASVRASLRHDGTPETSLRVVPNGAPKVVYKPPIGARGASMDHELVSRLSLPDTVGSHTVTFTVECKLVADASARQWKVFDSDIVSQIPQLKHTIEVPVTIHTAELDLPHIPVVDPSALSVEEPIEFTVVRVASASHRSPFAVIRYQIADGIDQGVGFGGHLVFEQDERVLKIPLDNKRTHIYLQLLAQLEGFAPGEVQVRYESDPDQAKLLRSTMTSVLGGPIELGTITIPEPEPE